MTENQSLESLLDELLTSDEEADEEVPTQCLHQRSGKWEGPQGASCSVSGKIGLEKGGSPVTGAPTGFSEVQAADGLKDTKDRQNDNDSLLKTSAPDAGSPDLAVGDVLPEAQKTEETTSNGTIAALVSRPSDIAMRQEPIQEQPTQLEGQLGGTSSGTPDAREEKQASQLTGGLDDFETLSTSSMDLEESPSLLTVGSPSPGPPQYLEMHRSSQQAVTPNPEPRPPPSEEPDSSSSQNGAHHGQHVVPPHLAALERAEAIERDLATGKGLTGQGSPPTGRGSASSPWETLREKLQWSKEEWRPDGQPDGRGGLVGGQLLLRADVVGPLEEALQRSKIAGEARTVAVFRSVIAVGTSSGVCLVLMTRSVTTDGTAKPATEVVQLGQPRPQEAAAVTCLAFSNQGNLLAVGHANGDLSFWELRRASWECVKTLKEVHVTPVVQAAFLEGSQIAAVTSDSRGRLVYHNVSFYLSLTALLAGRLSKSAQPVLLTEGRQLGPLCFLAALHPPHIPLQDASRSQPGNNTVIQQICDSMLVILSARGAFVGKVSAESRLGVLHNIGKPSGARAGCLPYAAWRLLPPAPAARYAFAHLALAWERQIHLVEVPIPILTANNDNLPPEKPTVKILLEWVVELPVSALYWLEGPALAIVMQSGPHAHVSLYDANGKTRRESLHVGDPLLHHSDIVGLQGLPEACHHNASAASFGGILMLGSQGVKLARLMSWQERLSGLRDIGCWELALLVGMDIQQGAIQAAAGESRAAHLWRGEGKGADAHQVADVLGKLLVEYLQAVLKTGEEATSPATRMQASAAADIAIELCLAMDRRSLLWSDVFPQFLAASVPSVLLEHMLPHIFLDQLTALAPEVMQALVEHCAAEGRPEAVEAAVMHMDIASLDLNQVVRLCRQHQLYSALAFIFPRALLDFVAPAAELMVAVAYATEDDVSSPTLKSNTTWTLRKQLAFKLLVYLRTCFQGLSFPPGSGALDPSILADTKAHLLGFLLYGTPSFIWRLLEAFGADESAGSTAALEELLPGPHPVLRCLMATDAGATLVVIREALVGCTLLDSALKAATHTSVDDGDESLAEQAVLNAVVSLLDAGVFRESRIDNSDEDKEPGLFHAMDFISSTVAEGRVSAAPAVIMMLLQWLAHGPWPAGRAPPKPLREQQFVALLQHLDLQQSGAATVGLEGARAQALAKHAGFFKAEAQVQHLAGNYAAALHCFLQTSTEAAFEYLDNSMNSPSASTTETAGKIWSSVQGMLPDLVEANSLALARLVLRCFPEEHSGIIRGLQGTPRLQYQYMKGAMQAAPDIDNDDGRGAQARKAIPLVSQSVGLGRNLQAEAQASELYIHLLCQFEPSAVLPFLQSNEAYRVQEVIAFCDEHGVLDAQAYLLERLGDLQAALDIHVRQLEHATQSLVDAVLEERISVNQLKAFWHPSSSHSALLGQLQSIPSPSDLPAEVTLATKLLKAAVALCQRHSRDASPDVTQQLWLRVLRGFVMLLRQLRSKATPRLPVYHGSDAKRSEAAMAWRIGVDSKEQLRSLKEAAEAHRQVELMEAVDCTTAAQRLLMHFMEETISDMAGYVPLSDIGARILHEFAADQFGDFKGSLVGLLAAYNYELSILQAANRLVTSDAYRILHSLYRSRNRSPSVEAVPGTVPHRPKPGHSTGESSDTAVPSFTSPGAAHENIHGGEPNSWASRKLPLASQREHGFAMLGRERPHSGNLGSRGNLSPMVRSGCDINFLRVHGLHSMTAGE